MQQSNSRRPWRSESCALTGVCTGRRRADTVIVRGRLVNVHTREIQDNVGVAIRHGRAALSLGVIPALGTTNRDVVNGVPFEVVAPVVA